MRTRALFLVAVAALALAGCGDHRLVLTVDVLSYLEDSQKSVTIGALPAGTLPAPVPIIDDDTINLISGMGDVAEVQSVTLRLGGLISAATGSGSGRLRLYLSDEQTPPLAAVPVLDVPVQFAAGAPDTVSAEAACAPEVAALFMKQKMRMAMVIDSAVVAPPGATGVAMSLQQLEAIVIAGRKKSL
jgi:hypothetical protein